jgi:2'-phosphotransferase
MLIRKLGMRTSAQVLIYIDIQKALDAGILFYLSDNGVILSEGDERGFISPAFFTRITDKNGAPIEEWIAPAAGISEAP